MKPVRKGRSPRKFSHHGDAKPHLIARLGPHCSYCEAHGLPPMLHVEHIYSQHAHPVRRREWSNFLLACPSCNSNKGNYLGPGRQRRLEARFLWPHLDNTGRAFKYSAEGNVNIVAHLSPRLRQIAQDTIAMVGLMKDPANAQPYDELGIAYSGVELRKNVWAEALVTREDFLKEPTRARARFFADKAVSAGFFSVWMEVFADRRVFRRELIRAFKADSRCYCGATRPLRRGRT